MPGCGEKIEINADVNAGLPEVPVDRAFVAVLVEHRLKLADIVAQTLGIDCGVFPTRIVIGLVRNFRGRAQRVIAKPPKALLLFVVVDELHRRRIRICA